jgi:hypothetical protein
MKFVVAAFFLTFAAAGAWAADSVENPEAFRFEVTGSGWLVNSAGSIQASGSPINLVTDLGVYQQQPTLTRRPG